LGTLLLSAIHTLENSTKIPIEVGHVAAVAHRESYAGNLHGTALWTSRAIITSSRVFLFWGIGSAKPRGLIKACTRGLG